MSRQIVLDRAAENMTRKTPNGLATIVMIATVLVGFTVIGLLIFDHLLLMTNSKIISYALLSVAFYLWLPRFHRCKMICTPRLIRLKADKS